jgi:uncharacterized protein YcaQ
VTYLFISQMINLILTSTDKQSTTLHISTLWEDWLHETSITPPQQFQSPIEKYNRNRQNPYPEHKYMTIHLPGLAQTLK